MSMRDGGSGNKFSFNLNRVIGSNGLATMNESKYVKRISNLSSSGAEARLTFITPINKPDAFVRPLTYDFGPEFIDNLAINMKDIRRDIFERGGFGGLTSGNYFLSTMNDCQNVDSMMPSNNVHRFGRRSVNDLYRFCLTVANMPSSYRYAKMAAHRYTTVYTGWCLDEPVSFNGTLNPDCQLVFTHMTNVKLKEVASRDGYLKYGYTELDGDILNPQTSMINSDASTELDMLVGPDHILENNGYPVSDMVYDNHPGIEDDDDDYFSTALDSESMALSRRPAPIIAKSRFNSPRCQQNRILHGIAKTLVSSRYNDLWNPDGETDYPTSNIPTFDFANRTMNSRILKSNMDGITSNAILGINHCERISLRTLTQLFPHIEQNTEILDVDHQGYDIYPEDEGSDLYGIVGYFIKTSIGAAASEHGLASLTFRYATSDPIASRFRPADDRESIWDNIFGEPYIDEDMHYTKSRVENALRYIEEHIFKPVEKFAGEIEVFVNYKSSDDTIIHLQLREQTDEINDDVILHHGDLGGFVSPQIGTVEEFKSGSEVMSGLVDFIGHFQDGNMMNRI